MDQLNMQSASSWPIRLGSQEERQFCNKLQAHKSSFQAWKTVSFGCSLLALFLIACKWREVSNDLSMLTGIEQMLEQQTNRKLTAANETRLHNNDGVISPSSSSTNENHNSHILINQPSSSSASSDTRSNQALAMQNLAETLSLLNPATAPSSNSSFPNKREPSEEPESGDQSSTLNAGKSGGSSSIDSIIRDQIHLFLSQEFNANHLLRLEIELFSAEFRSSKLTLLLSLVLVAVYIVSWMLMTLAIKDTQISNDISLRNILLLSIFGAIDIAASVAFIMVRLIMYSAKNNPFANDLLQAVGLKDSPIKLNADQATSFAALRLVAMRSSAANVDLFVGSLVALITILRLYAIARALTYYRRLRRVNNCYMIDTNRNPNVSQSTSLSTSRRSSAATTNLEQPLGLNLSHQTTLDGFLHHPHSYQYGTSHAKSIWSPPQRPSSYSVMAPGGNQFATIGHSNSYSHNNLNNSNNNPPMLISDNQIGPVTEEQTTKFVVVQNSSNNQAINSNTKPRARRHASVETLQHGDLQQGNSLLLVQARDQLTQPDRRQSRPHTQNRRARQRASSSPRYIISVNPDGNQSHQHQSFDHNATLCASNLVFHEQQQQQLAFDSEPVQVMNRDGPIFSGNSTVKSKNKGKFVIDSRKSMPNSGEIYRNQQKHQQYQHQQQEKANVSGSRKQNDHILISSSLQSEHNNANSNNAATAEIISSPIKAFKTLRNKTSNVVPTLYTLLSPSSMSLVNQDSRNLNIESNKTASAIPAQSPSTKYKLVARYRQLSSVDSNATITAAAAAAAAPIARLANGTTKTTTTTTTATADSSSSESSSTSCGPDDSDASISSQLIPINGRQYAAGMKHSDEFVMSSLTNAAKLQNATLIKKQQLISNKNQIIIGNRENQQQQTIVMSANDDDDDDDQHLDLDENGNNNNNENNTIKSSDKVLLGKCKYW